MANPLAGRLQIYVSVPWNETEMPERLLEEQVHITDNDGELLKVTDRWIEYVDEADEMLHGTITMHVETQIVGGVQIDEANELIANAVSIDVPDGELIDVVENSVLGAKTDGALRPNGIPAPNDGYRRPSDA